MHTSFAMQYQFKLNKKGKGDVRHIFPAKTGRYSEITTPEFEFVFNMRGEIKTIRGLGTNWPHPFEFLKRTEGNDWVYYTVRDNITDKGFKSWVGEYYLPCLPYSSNAFWEYNPFGDPRVMSALAAWSRLFGDLYAMRQMVIPESRKQFIDLVMQNDENALHAKANELHSIIGPRISVLPPDARLVDYEVIPLIIADGCLYRCGFCSVKTGRRFHPRTAEQIDTQIEQLKTHYGPDMADFSALFLGNHDALAAGSQLVADTVEKALERFPLRGKNGGQPSIFLFASIDSFLKADFPALKRLGSLPVSFYMNIGFESVHQGTLDTIQKPLVVEKVRDAFHKMLEVNAAISNLHITGNFLLGDPLPAKHHESVRELLANVPEEYAGKGTIYLSPFTGRADSQEAIMERFNQVKAESRLPVYMYLIQRL